MPVFRNLKASNSPYVLASLGEYCRMARRNKGLNQYDVAQDTGFTQQNISAFERGENNNALLLLWYIKHGLLEVLEKWGEL